MATMEAPPVGSPWFKPAKAIKLIGQAPAPQEPAASSGISKSATANGAAPPSPSKFQALPDFDFDEYSRELGFSEAEKAGLISLGFEGEALEVVKPEEAAEVGFKLIRWKKLVTKDRAYRAYRVTFL